MTPPEIILDRYMKETFPKSYSGKLDIEQISSPSFRTFLYGLQIETNEALGLENANASGGVVHPPFHFDYLHATATNAHAIPHECFWFIALTLPLIKSVTDVSKHLSRSSVVLRVLHLDSGALPPDTLLELSRPHSVAVPHRARIHPSYSRAQCGKRTQRGVDRTSSSNRLAEVSTHRLRNSMRTDMPHISFWRFFFAARRDSDN